MREAQEYWTGDPGVEKIPPPGDLPNPGIEPGSPALQVDSLPAELPGKQSQSHGGDVDSSGKLQFNSTVT